jgi:endonuclease/exonuclease/phosphatase (EEP) superfamily protein YafD
MIRNVILTILALFFIVGTALPLIRLDPWWIRMFDFPRAQIAVGGTIVLGIGLAVWGFRGGVHLALLGVLAICMIYQVSQMLPYTAIASKQVLPASNAPSGGTFSLLIANVLMTNRDSSRFLGLVEEYDPDMILTVETDGWWEQQLRVLEEEYPHTVKMPLENTYGMLLYSRLTLVEPEVRFLLEPDIPSIRTGAVLASGRPVQLRFVHPRPPAPQEATESTQRDAELLLVGREVKDLGQPVIVAGDLNDVAWSHTTRLFQEVSGLLDPRRGRGMYSTFSANNPFMRWPLDHVFHSNHFKLIELDRLPAFGSDHFPVFIKLNLEAGAEQQQERPEADPEEQQEATEKIEKGIEQ